MPDTEKTPMPSFERFYERHTASARLCAHLLVGEDEVDTFLKQARPELESEFKKAGTVLDFAGWMVANLLKRSKKAEGVTPVALIRSGHAKEFTEDIESLAEDRELATDALRKMPLKERDFLINHFAPEKSTGKAAPSDDTRDRVRNLTLALFRGISRRRKVETQKEDLENKLLVPLLSSPPGKPDALPDDALQALSKSAAGRGLQRRVVNLQLILPHLCRVLRDKLANPVVTVEKGSIAIPEKGGLNIAILGMAAAAFAVAAGLYFFAKQKSMVKVEIPPDPARVRIVGAVAAELPAGMDSLNKNALLTNHFLKLISGCVHLDLNVHTAILVTGPAELEFRNSASVHLHSGMIVARNRGRKQGLKIRTPHVTLTDRGAEIGIDVRGDSTRIEMIRGQADAKSDRPETLFVGERKSYPGGRQETFRFQRAFAPVPLSAIHDAAEPREWPLNRAAIPKLRIDRVSSPPVIDAKLDDWSRESLFSVNAIEHPDNYAAKLTLAFDDQALYFGGFVVDPHPMRSEITTNAVHANFLSGGGLQLRLQSIVAEETNLPTVITDLWFSKASGVAGSAIRRAGMTNLMPSGVSGAFVMHTNQFIYTFEYALPWSELDIPAPESGSSVRASVEIIFGAPSGKDWIGRMTELINFRAISRNPTNRVHTASKPHAWGKLEFR
jgi:hypothetical protein